MRKIEIICERDDCEMLKHKFGDRNYVELDGIVFKEFCLHCAYCKVRIVEEVD